jgi:hypothetical protein
MRRWPLALRLVIASVAATGVLAAVDPGRLELALRVEVLALALIAVGALAHLLAVRAPAPPPTPFDPAPIPVPTVALPADLERLGLELRTLGLRRGASTTPIALPLRLRGVARRVAANRLAQHHGLALDDPRATTVLDPELRAALAGERIIIDVDRLVAALEAV